jgi:hypothetical protein
MICNAIEGLPGRRLQSLTLADFLFEPLNPLKAWHLEGNSGLDSKIFAQMLRL